MLDVRVIEAVSRDCGGPMVDGEQVDRPVEPAGGPQNSGAGPASTTKEVCYFEWRERELPRRFNCATDHCRISWVGSGDRGGSSWRPVVTEIVQTNVLLVSRRQERLVNTRVNSSFPAQFHPFAQRQGVLPTNHLASAAVRLGPNVEIGEFNPPLVLASPYFLDMGGNVIIAEFIGLHLRGVCRVGKSTKTLRGVNPGACAGVKGVNAVGSPYDFLLSHAVEIRLKFFFPFDQGDGQRHIPRFDLRKPSGGL